MTSFSIRPYRPADRESVRDICYDTALYGTPASALTGDRDIVADALVGYYTDFEPESLFVAEAHGRVEGYCAGCLDTRRYERILRWRIVPKTALRFLARGHFLRPRLWRFLLALARSGARRDRILRPVLGRYPSHCHINIAKCLRRSGAGSALFETFMRHLAARRIRGIHVSTPTEGGKAFFSKKGFIVLGTYPAPEIVVGSGPEAWIMGKNMRH